MIQYPTFKNNATIGVTAPSSGVPEPLHPLLKDAVNALTQDGFSVKVLDTPWQQQKGTSAPARQRAEELNQLMTQDDIDLVMPPWGGELLIEILEHIDFQSFKTKWILGYSDTSLLLLATTLNTGIATAHGTNLIDLRGTETDQTTAMWKDVLSTNSGEDITQFSSPKYQKEWDFDHPTPHIFKLTEDTEWKVINHSTIQVHGRLLGGCIDTIQHLVGTPYGKVEKFQADFIGNEPIIWFFEKCDMDTGGLRRALIQMKYAGWFDNVACIMFGRSSGNHPVEDYTALDVYQNVADELGIPVIYDIDCGHVPPQNILVNGASAVVEVDKGKGKITQTFN